MKTKEFDNIIDGILEEETRKLLREQISDGDHLIDSTKGFQSLLWLADKITEVKPIGDDGLVIIVNGIPSSEFDGGSVQSDLMQGLHHDLKENGFAGSYDIDINTQGDDSTLDLTISIIPNDDELSQETEIDEVEDNGELTNTFGQALYEKEPEDTNPTADDKKDLILGDEKEIDESDEKWIQKAFNKIDKKGTEGKCTGDKFGGPGCPEGSKQYNMAKTLRKMNESTKKTITLNQSEMADLLSKIIKEAVQDNIKEQIETPANIAAPSNGVPGLDVTKKVRKDSGKENEDALKAVEKKIKDYLSFEGNDDPESPNQIGQGEEKVSVPASESQDLEIELNRGRNPADLTYDSEPGERFRERAKLSLVGASEMGNSHEYANVVNPNSKVGENVAKTAEKRKEARENEPIYDKEAVPIKNSPDKPNRPRVDDPAVAGDILRMKQMTGYKEKTQ